MRLKNSIHLQLFYLMFCLAPEPHVYLGYKDENMLSVGLKTLYISIASK